jgi:hypothetical protein
MSCSRKGERPEVRRTWSAGQHQWRSDRVMNFIGGNKLAPTQGKYRTDLSPATAGRSPRSRSPHRRMSSLPWMRHIRRRTGGRRESAAERAVVLNARVQDGPQHGAGGNGKAPACPEPTRSYCRVSKPERCDHCDFSTGRSAAQPVEGLQAEVAEISRTACHPGRPATPQMRVRHQPTKRPRCRAPSPYTSASPRRLGQHVIIDDARLSRTQWPCVRDPTDPIPAHHAAISAGRRLAETA